MAKFRNKKNKKEFNVSLQYYINLMRKNPNYEEVKDDTTSKKDTKEVAK